MCKYMNGNICENQHRMNSICNDPSNCEYLEEEYNMEMIEILDEMLISSISDTNEETVENLLERIPIAYEICKNLWNTI